MSTNRKFFIDLFRARKLSQNRVGELMGWDRSLISRKLSGDRQFSFDEVTKLAGILLVSPDEVIKNLGHDWRGANIKTMPVSLSCDDSGAIFALDTPVKKDLDFSGADLAILDGSESFRRGWTYFVNTQASGNIGGLNYVEFDDGSTAICAVVNVSALSVVCLNVNDQSPILKSPVEIRPVIGISTL